MGDFSKSVKKALSQVFGRGDLEEVLGEDVVFSDSQPMPVASESPGKSSDLPPKSPEARPERSAPADLKAIAQSQPGEDVVEASGGAPPPEPAELAQSDLAIELPPSETYEDHQPLSRAVKLITEGEALVESESFIRELGFGDPHAPYPAAIGVEEEEAPAQRDTLDITGIFEDFVQQEDDPFDEMEVPVLLNEVIPREDALPDPPDSLRGDLAEEADEDEDPAEAPEAPEEQDDDEDLPLDDFGGESLTGSAFIDGEAPAVFHSTAGTHSVDLEATGSATGPQTGTSDTGRVLSSRGRDLWKKQKARGSNREGPPPATIWDEPAIRASIAQDIERDSGRSNDTAFRRVLETLRQTVEEEPIDLPPFPSDARQLLGTATEEEVLDIIRTSPSLAGNVVKVANSPFYMSAKPVASLNAAVMRIGLDQVRRVSLAALVGSSYEVDGFQRVMQRIQLHSFATAIAAELIAPMTRIAREEAFLSGLLHDAGMVLTYRMMKKAVERTGGDWVMDQRTLRQMARKYHQRLGALFLGGWDLAPSIASTMAFHHHPNSAEDDFIDHVKLIHVADALSERAVRHSKTPYWKRGMAQRSPEASQKEWARAADVDGVGEIVVTDLLYQAPPQLDMTAMHGVIRSVLLKLDSRRHSAVVSENDPDNSRS